MKSNMKVALIMGSKTDYKALREAEICLQEFGIKVHVEVISAHRTPDKMFQFAKSARENGFGVIIAGAGGAAHLPGMVAALTTVPVIGVPVAVGKLEGLDALLSIVQMPKGIPVATVAIENSWNAGLLATQILSIGDSKQATLIAKKLALYRSSQKHKVAQMNKDLKSI
jgi:5-(carboxyamino)imidazole ribonucleotide mutase